MTFETLWYIDRAAGLVSYVSLYLAVLTGVFYNTKRFGELNRAADRVHVPISVFATLTVLGHGVVGAFDTLAILDGAVPSPNYPINFFVNGVLVGVGGLLLLMVAVIAFLDPRRFDRPYSPRVVHAFAYGGYAFATVHTVAVGTDIGRLLRVSILSSVAFVVYLLIVRSLSAKLGETEVGTDMA
ncbi:MAG: hypothetical protein SV253_04965 [Halobacteria archaeon]|nr:hypothetical protein [Halobacteria archaeon]